VLFPLRPSCRALTVTPSRRPRSTWGRATRPLWTEEELALYVAARRRKSARIDPGERFRAGSDDSGSDASDGEPAAAWPAAGR
jgi:hypothetical protein